MKRLVFLSLLFGFPAAISAAGSPTTIILVRHAERVSPTGDNSLSEKGRERSQELKRTLADVPLDAIFVSDLKRTGETANPIASARHLTAITIPANDIDVLVTKLKSLPAGSSALVVHHSNTLPKIVEGLGASIPPIADTEFDRLIVVTLYSGKPKLLTFRYGAR